MTLLLVAVGGAAGAAARYGVARALPGRRATLLVNLLGSLLLGLLAPAAPAPGALLGVGFCGALTTYSTFAVEVLDGDDGGGGWRYAVVSTLGCLAACALGLLLSGPG